LTPRHTRRTFSAMTCFFCGGAAHPSTGCSYSPTVLACYGCTVGFWTWFLAQQAKRSKVYRDKRGRLHADFYAAAGKH
jgi:hypothetical protein